MSVSASCFSKSNDGDIIVYSGSVRSAVDHNTDDIMVHVSFLIGGLNLVRDYRTSLSHRK